MNGEPALPTPLWPLCVFFGAAIGIVALMIALSFVLGERHKGRATGEPYESGMPPTGSAMGRMGIQYFLVALCFVVFDVEAVFIFAWAVCVRELGWPGYMAAVVFIGVLLAVLVYLSRVGALDVGGVRKSRQTRWEGQADL